MSNRGGRSPQRTDPNRRPTKAERKEEARLEREAIQARMAARRRSRTIALVVGLLVGAGVIALIVTMSGGSDEPTDTAADAGELPGLLVTDAPWPANTDQLAERLQVLDLPAEGVAQHLHVPLYVYVNGDAVTVPANMGIGSTVIAPLHTHDDLGTLHVESAAIQDFTLGQAFDVWGVRLSSNCLGGYCGSGGSALRVFSGGQEVTGDPRDVVLEDTKAVVVTFGPEGDVPDPVPTGFPSGAPSSG